MRKLLFILILLTAGQALAQTPKFAGVILDTLTTPELDALDARYKIRGSLYYDRTKGNHVTWDPVAGDWADVGDGLGAARDVGPFTVVDADNATLDDNAVTESKIIDGAVSTSKLADGSVSTPKIFTNAVTSEKILDGTIAGVDILDGGINTNDLADGAVRGSKLQDYLGVQPIKLDVTVNEVTVPVGSIPVVASNTDFTWTTASSFILGEYPNLDTDTTNDVTIAGSQDVTGEKTFQTTSELVAAARFENEQTGQDVRLQMLADNPTGTPVGFWFGGYADGTNNWFSWSRASDLSSYAMRLDRDNGNMEIFGNIITPGTVDGVDVSNFADGDKGDVTIAGASISIDNGAVGTAELATGAVTSEVIADGAIQSVDIEATNSAVDGYVPTHDNLTGGVTWVPYTGSGSSAYSYQTLITDAYSLLNTDVTDGGTVTDKKRWNKVSTNISLILDKDDISLMGSPFIIQHAGADSVFVKPEVGTTFTLAGSGTLTNDGISIKNYEAVSFLKDSSTSFYVQGVFAAVNDGTCASIYTTSNAINDECNLEANNATVFLVNDADVTITSATTPTPQTGTYFTKLAVNATSGVTDVNELTLEGVTSGQNVTVSVYVQKITGSTNITLALNTADGWSVGDAVTVTGGTGTWTEYQLTGTASANDPEMRITFLAGSSVGDEIGIDNLRVTLN